MIVHIIQLAGFHCIRQSTILSMNETEPATLGVRVFGSASFLLVTIVNLMLNTLLIIVFQKTKSYSNLQGKKSFFKNAFYHITWQLIVCDMLTNFLEFFYSIPLTLAGYNVGSFFLKETSQIYGNSFLQYFPCVFETVAYNGCLFFSFLMTLNRVTVFLFPRLNRLLFQENLNVTIACYWLFLFAIISLWNAIGVYKTFDAKEFHYTFIHFDDQGSYLSIGINKFYALTGTYLPITMFIVYVLMIASMKFKMHFQSSTTTDSREFSLLAQAFLICGVLELENLVFNIVPNLEAPGQWNYIVNFIGRWISLLMTSINAIVLFSFNKDIRRRLKDLFRGSSGSSQIVVTSLRNSSNK